MMSFVSIKACRRPEHLLDVVELLSQPGESSFLLWIAIYLMCYLSVLIGGGIVFSRKLQRSPKVLLVLPTIVLVFAIAAPIVSKLLLNLKTHWQSLTLRYQRADGTLATEWSYFMAYAPGAVTTQVRFQHNDLVSHPPLEDKERQFYEHSVQGEQTYLDNVMLYLTGRNYLLARRLRKATRFDVGGGGVLVQPRRYGAVKVTGKVGGGLDKHQNAVLVVGEKAGAITWLRRSGGLAEFSAVLDNTPQEELWQMLNRTWAFKPSDTDNPWWLPLPPTPEIPAFIVFLEHNTAPPMEPLSGWRSRRHIKLWIVQVPVRLPTPKNGRIALPPATIGGKVIRVVREESNGTSSYSLYQKAFILPAAARNARRIWLRFDHDVGVSSIYRGPRKQLVFQVYNPRAGAWTNVPNRKKIDGLNYVDGRGQVIVRLQFESEPGKPGPPTRRLGSPPPGGPSFELRHLQVAVEMQP